MEYYVAFWFLYPYEVYVLKGTGTLSGNNTNTKYEEPPDDGETLKFGGLFYE